MEVRVIKFLRVLGLFLGIVYGAIYLSAMILAITGVKDLNYSVGYFDFAFVMGSIGISLAISFKSTPTTE